MKWVSMSYFVDKDFFFFPLPAAAQAATVEKMKDLMRLKSPEQIHNKVYDEWRDGSTEIRGIICRNDDL